MKSILAFLTPKKVTYYISDKSTLRQALEKFDAHKFTIVPILDKNGKYRGTISQGDMLRFIKQKGSFNLEEAESISIKEIERYRSYRSLKIDAEFVEVLALSQEQNFIPIVDDSDTYIGIIKRSDIIKYLYKELMPALNEDEK